MFQLISRNYNPNLLAMTKGYYTLFLFLMLSLLGQGQTKETQLKNIEDNVNVLKSYLKQIVNKSIYYNYYLGDDLYTERSFINKASVSLTNNNRVALFIYYTTQKYDLHSSTMMRSEHGETVIFDPSNISSIKLKGKLSDYSKSELGLLVINFKDEVEKHINIKRKNNQDPTLLASPLVNEFELPFLKTTEGNPEALQGILLDLQKSFRKETKIQ